MSSWPEPTYDLAIKQLQRAREEAQKECRPYYDILAKLDMRAKTYILIEGDNFEIVYEYTEQEQKIIAACKEAIEYIMKQHFNNRWNY